MFGLFHIHFTSVSTTLRQTAAL